MKHTVESVSPNVRVLTRDGCELQCPYTVGSKACSCGTWCPLFEFVTKQLPEFRVKDNGEETNCVQYVRLHCGSAKIFIDM